MADLAYAFHWPPDVLWDMEVDDMLEWHRQIERINKQLRQK